MTPEEAAALEAENAQLKEQLRQNRFAGIHAGNVAFAEGLITAGKVLPAEQAVVVATLDHFANQGTPVEFAEGDENKPLLDGLKSLLDRLPKAVEFNEVATHEHATGGVALNDAEAIRKAAVEFQEAEAKAGRDVTYVLAVQHVVSQRKGV